MTSIHLNKKKKNSHLRWFYHKQWRPIIALVGKNNLIQNDVVKRDKERLKITCVKVKKDMLNKKPIESI